MCIRDRGINTRIPLTTAMSPPLTISVTLPVTTALSSYAFSISSMPFCDSTFFLERRTFPSPSFTRTTQTSISSPGCTVLLGTTDASLLNSPLGIIPVSYTHLQGRQSCRQFAQRNKKKPERQSRRTDRYIKQKHCRRQCDFQH